MEDRQSSGKLIRFADRIGAPMNASHSCFNHDSDGVRAASRTSRASRATRTGKARVQYMDVRLQQTLGFQKLEFVIYPSQRRSAMRWTIFVILLTAFSCGSDEEDGNPVSSLSPTNPSPAITTAAGTCQVGMVLGPGGSCSIGSTGHTLRIENDSVGSACVGANCFPPVPGVTVNFNDNGVLVISVRSDRGPSLFSPDQWTIVAIG